MNNTLLVKPPSKLYFTSTRHRNDKQATKFIDEQNIIKIVSFHFGIPFKCLCVPCRRKEVVYCRQVIMYFLTKYTNLSFKSIGAIFGGRDHTTVIHSSESVRDRIDTDDKVFFEIEELTKQIIDMNIKVNDDETLVSLATESIHILHNLRNSTVLYRERPGVETRNNKRRWEGIADAHLQRISGKEVTHNAKTVKIELTSGPVV